MPERHSATESEEGESWWTSGDGVSGPHPEAKVARIQRASLDPQLRDKYDKYVHIDVPDGGLPAELAPFCDKKAFMVPGDSGAPQDIKPAWFNEQLFLEGQEFSRKNLAGLCQAQLLDLFFLFALPDGVDPLVGTGKSDTIETAGKRYLSTNMRLLSWYSSDPFDPASECYRDLTTVRRLHAVNRKACDEGSPEELSVKFTIGKEQPRPLLCPAADLIQTTLTGLSSNAYTGPCPVRSTLPPGCPAGAVRVTTDRFHRPFLNQVEMGITQWGFFGLFICKPEAFAAHHATRRELEALVHMWAVLGYCLGIDDRYNWGLGGLDASLRRSEALLRYISVPSLRQVAECEPGIGAERWEHMCRVMVEGMRQYVPLASFESNLVYMTEDVLGLGTVLPKALTWRQWLQLWRLRVFLQYLPRCFKSWSVSMSIGLDKLFRQKAVEAGIRDKSVLRVAG